MFEVLLQLDPLQNPLGVGLAAVPAVINVGLLAFAAHALPRDRTTFAFALFVGGLLVWQLFDLAVRSAIHAETAAAWRALLRLGQLLAIPAGVHFALLFGQRDRWASAPGVLALLYIPPLFFDACYQAGFIQERLAWTPIWGWITEPDLGPVYTACTAWFSLLALALPLLLALNLIRARRHPLRYAGARLLLAGMIAPVTIGVLTEGVLPLVFGLQQLPLTSTTLSTFSVASALALSRYGLLRVSTQTAAEAVLDTLGDSLLILTPGGRMLYANTHAATTFSLDREDLESHFLPALFPDAAGARALRQQRWEQVLDGEVLTGVEARLRGVDGDFPALLSLAPVPIQRRGKPGVVMLVHDVTEIRRTQDALAQARTEAEAANREKSLFLANMSHELRTPLNAIIGYSELLLEEAEEEPALRAYESDLQRIRTSGRYLIQLINDILDLSKVEAGMLDVLDEPVALGPLLDELKPMAEELCRPHANRFILKAEPAVARGDRVRIRQILLNLLSNAARFTEQGEVSLSVRSEGQFIRMDVRDTGIGMDASQTARLFQLFVQVHDGPHGNKGGTGLGLALSRRLAERMGGELSVQSAPGVGSTFRLKMPRAEG